MGYSAVQIAMIANFLDIRLMHYFRVAIFVLKNKTKFLKQIDHNYLTRDKIGMKSINVRMDKVFGQRSLTSSVLKYSTPLIKQLRLCTFLAKLKKQLYTHINKVRLENKKWSYLSIDVCR